MVLRLLYGICLILALGGTSYGTMQEAIEENSPFSKEINLHNQPLGLSESSKPIVITLWHSPLDSKMTNQPLILIPEYVLAKIMLIMGQDALPLALICRDSYLTFSKIPAFNLQRSIHDSYRNITHIFERSSIVKRIPNLESGEAKQQRLQEYARFKREQEKLLKEIEERREYIVKNHPENELIELEELGNVDEVSQQWDQELKPQVHSLIKEIEEDPTCCPVSGLSADLLYSAAQTGYNLAQSDDGWCRWYKKIIRNRCFLIGSIAVMGTSFFVGGYYVHTTLMTQGLEAKEAFYNQTSVNRTVYTDLERVWWECKGTKEIKNFFEICLGNTYWSQSPRPYYGFYDPSGCAEHQQEGNITQWLDYVKERCGINTSFWLEQVNSVLQGNPPSYQNSLCSKNIDNTTISCGSLFRGRNELAYCDAGWCVFGKGDVGFSVIRGIPELARQAILPQFTVYAGVTGACFAFYTSFLIASYLLC